MRIRIRKGEKKDLTRVLELIRELADYEKSPDAVTNTLEMLEEDGFGKNALFRFFVAEVENESAGGGNTIAGMALFYPKYSTWKGRGIYLDDIVVSEKYRRLGIGKMLFDEVVNTGKRENAKLIWWQVLDWNTPAINFYKKYNSSFDTEWLDCRLTEEQINNF